MDNRAEFQPHRWGQSRMDIDKKITELEIHVSHQEQTIEDLNQVMLSQQEKIDELRSELLRLERAFKDLSSSVAKDISEESPPPHY